MKHLIFVQHGMFGVSYYMNNFKNKLEAAFTDSIVILPHKNNFLYSTFGTQICGDKMLQVVEETIAANPDAITISFIGHSFGGILSRYVIGKLEEKNIFDKIIPLAYISISTPHIGVITNKHVVKLGLSYLTGTTGKDLIGNTLILEELAKFGSSYITGLEKFSLKLLYGNLFNDDVIAETACLYSKNAIQNLMEIVPKRLFVVKEHFCEHPVEQYVVNEDVENIDVENIENIDKFTHIRNINWTRKVVDLSEYSNSHSTIVGRYTFIPFLTIKKEEGFIVLLDIIAEMTLAMMSIKSSLVATDSSNYDNRSYYSIE